MNSNIVNLLKKVPVVPVSMGIAVFVTELSATYISNRIKKSSVIIVPAEPNYVAVIEIDEFDSDNNPLIQGVDLAEWMHNNGHTLGSGGLVETADLVDDETSSLTQIAADAGYDGSDETETDPLIQHILEEIGDNPIAPVNYNKVNNVTDDVVEERAPSVVNVFAVDTDWDYERELQQRNPEEPYIIHADEYISDEMGYKQETLTYYEGDNIMATMADVPIYNWSALMGQLRWGHGSKDKNVVYIRNERMHKEWEILLHSGSFEIEVQGLHLEGGELKHSLRKFRDD